MIKEIPRFDQEQYSQICRLFNDNNIPFEAVPVQISSYSHGGYHEYNFHVTDEYFLTAIEILKDYFGFIHYEKIVFSGVCPACSYNVEQKFACPECELSFNPIPALNWDEHPFCIFLKQHNLA
jgi:hypothetical protein